MNALEALHSRNSVAQLSEPGPDKEQLENILRAAIRANDHRRLRPWKFLLITGENRSRLGQLMADIAEQDDPDITDEKYFDIVTKTTRAPTIIAVVAALKADDKVPEIEQLLSAGGAAQLMMAAAHAQGVGAIWRTGSVTYDRRLHRAMGLEENDKLVGFLYMGTPKACKPLASVDPYQFVHQWGL